MNEPNITDWINSFGVLFTVILGIIGYLNLKKDSKSQENKINKLTDLAAESQKQTNEMIRQTKLMHMNYQMYFQDNINKVKPDLVLNSINDSAYYLKNIGKGSATVTKIYSKDTKFTIAENQFTSQLPYLVRVDSLFVFSFEKTHPSELINTEIVLDYLDDNNVPYVLKGEIVNNHLKLYSPEIELFDVGV